MTKADLVRTLAPLPDDAPVEFHAPEKRYEVGFVPGIDETTGAIVLMESFNMGED